MVALSRPRVFDCCFCRIRCVAMEESESLTNSTALHRPTSTKRSAVVFRTPWVIFFCLLPSSNVAFEQVDLLCSHWFVETDWVRLLFREKWETPATGEVGSVYVESGVRVCPRVRAWRPPTSPRTRLMSARSLSKGCGSEQALPAQHLRSTSQQRAGVVCYDCSIIRQIVSCVPTPV